jgi:regulator of ribonuclease activity A
MSEITPTADLYDEHGEALQSCDLQFTQYGNRRRFQGIVTTLRCHEDNAILKQVIREPGHGKVVVVDSDGSLHCAMLGDNMAEVAASNGWEGIIINGAVRDAVALAGIDVGVKALGTNPRRSHKHGAGQREVPVSFGGVVFTPGATLVSDEDGVVVLPASTNSQ